MRSKTERDAHLSALVRRMADGDQDAFVELYDATSAPVFGLVVRLLRDRAQSEEVTQEVYLQVWQQSHRFDPGRGTALAWVMTCAHRRAVDRARSSDSARRRDTTYRHLQHTEPVDETVATYLSSLEAADVRAALTALSDVQRQAIDLAYFGGHTYREVSTLLGVPLGTTKSRIRDGLLRLRDALAEPAAPVVP